MSLKAKAITLLGVSALACGPDPDPRFIGPVSSSAIGAALSAYVVYGHEKAPRSLAINVPPGTPVDIQDLRAVLPESTAVALSRDTSLYDSAHISADSLHVLHEVYDIRLLGRSTWDSMFARDSFNRGIRIKGTLYQISHKWCGGWPCHGGALVDVQKSWGHYRGVTAMYWVE